MSQIHLEIDLENKYFRLTGNISELRLIRRARHYLQNLGSIDTESSIAIPYAQGEAEATLTRIRRVLNDFEFTEVLSEEIKSVLKGYLQEEQNFTQFSEAAKSIRDNHLSAVNKEEFKHFTERLSVLLPNRKLYPLQLLAAYHLAFSQNACNFSVPGSGKTTIVYSAYAYLKSLKEDNPKQVDKLVVIGPLSSFGPWEDEYEECFGKPARSRRLTGQVSKDERIKYFYSSNPAEITLLSYQAIPGLISHLQIFLAKHPSMVILDEAHKIKNIEGGVLSSAALELAKFCKARIVLTGTPAPNGYEDLFNLFKFIWPSKKIISFHPYQLKDMSKSVNDSRIPALVEEIKPYFIRIKKSHLNLPDPKNVDPIIVKMGKEQKEIYEFIENSYMDFFIRENSPGGFKNLLAQARLIRLMQASTNPALLQKPLDQYFTEQGIHSTVFIEDSEILAKIMDYSKLETPSKFVKAEELVRSIIDKGEKCIIWTIFIQNIKDLAKHLNSAGIETRELWGETPIEQDEPQENIETREKIIADFHNPSSTFKVLIANPFAIAESISLHKACHNAIYLERSFNAGNFIQSKDRIHRYGLAANDKISYFYILSNNNIDLTIHQRLKAKEAKMLKIIESEEIPLFSILDEGNSEDEDMRSLIRNYAAKP